MAGKNALITRKTAKMRRVEERFDRPLEELIPDLYRSMTQQQVARHLGVDPATMNRWFLVLGIPTSHRKLAADVALTPGEES